MAELDSVLSNVLFSLQLSLVFLQTEKQVYWLMPILLSLIPAVMEFCTALRVLIYSNVNRIFCWAMRPLCDRLPIAARVYIYFLFDSLVDNFKPSNDFQWREVSGVTSVVITGGAKVHSENAAELPEPTSTQGKNIPHYLKFSAAGEYQLIVELRFIAHTRRVSITVYCRKYPVCFEEDCEEEQYKRLYRFIDRLMKEGSGSLESCRAAKDRVYCRVRGIEESIFCYIRNGFPHVYILNLENATIR